MTNGNRSKVVAITFNSQFFTKQMKRNNVKLITLEIYLLVLVKPNKLSIYQQSLSDLRREQIHSSLLNVDVLTTMNIP
jgi:hypothetical protein